MSAIKLYKGVSIYKVDGSSLWYVRVWDRDRKKYIVKSTSERTALKARAVAKDLALELLRSERQVERQYTFKYFATKFINRTKLVGSETRNTNYLRVLKWVVQNEDWGLVARFGSKDVREIKTKDVQAYMEVVSKKKSLASSTLNTILAGFRNVMKVAREEGVIDRLPDTPRRKQKDNPRPYFRFYPLVSKEDDTYQLVLRTAKQMAEENVVVRGVPVTTELYDIILFLTHSFVRPITTELYAIRHEDVTVAEDPVRLIVTVRDGKTGFRATNTMSAAVSVYKRVCQRQPDRKPSDYIFLPMYLNRQTAGKIIQRQFHELLERMKLQTDQFSGNRHTLYSLRHTAICMRLILSEGKVNIYNLAKNCGTSVDQIERFYARNLPLSKELARNLQSFG